MFSEDPKDLIEASRNGNRLVRDHLVRLSEMIEEYHGPSYVSNCSRYSHENSFYTFAGLYVPKLVFGDPRFRARTVRTGTQRRIAQASRHALNRIVRQTRMKRQYEAAALDMLFAFGVYQTGLRKGNPIPNMPDSIGIESPSIPFMKRVPQDQFVIDVDARTQDECGIMGHRFEWDIRDIESAAKENPSQWVTSTVDALRVGGTHSTDQRDMIRPGRDARQRVSTQKRIEGFVVWVPSHDHKDAEAYETGTIYTLVDIATNSGKKRPANLKPPRPYFGHPRGPYSTFGVYDVPGEVLPLGPLTAMDRQIQELSSIMQVIEERARKYRRLALAEGSIADELLGTEDEYLIGVETADFDRSKVETIEIGGASQHDVAFSQIKSDLVSRGLAVSDALEGNVTGRGSATENTIANSASETRAGRILDRFSDGVVATAESILWLAYHSESVVLPLGEEASDEMDSDEEVWWYGGVEPGEPHSFEDLELEVEALTVGRRTREERMVIADKRLQAEISVAQAQVMMPFLRGRDMLRRWGEAHDLYDVQDAIDQAAFEQFAQGLQGQPQLPEAPAMFRGFTGSGTTVQGPKPGGFGGGGMLTKRERAMDALGSASPSGGPKPLLSAPSGGGL